MRVSSVSNLDSENPMSTYDGHSRNVRSSSIILTKDTNNTVRLS